MNGVIITLRTIYYYYELTDYIYVYRYLAYRITSGIMDAASPCTLADQYRIRSRCSAGLVNMETHPHKKWAIPTK